MNRSLKVSLSTDAVIYLPFYLAYFGGDFNDTPYGPVDIQITGLNDIRFNYYDDELEEESKKPNPRLRGDAFMTLDVLFGLADIGIGDTGFVNILRGEEQDDETNKHSVFTELSHNGENTISRYLSYINGQAVGNDDISGVIDKSVNAHPRKLQEQIEKTELKIAGGLIRKPALKGIIKNNEFIDVPKNFITVKKKKAYKAFTYPKHSTSYYYLKNKLRGRSIEFEEPKAEIDFGNEIEYAASNTVCFSCDFIALRMANKSFKGGFKDYNLVEDFTCSKDRLLWSGFILDDLKFSQGDKQTQNLYRAFFYAIDRCLLQMATFLENNDSQGLHYFIRSKLTADKNKLGDVFKVLIANETIKNQLLSKVSNISSSSNNVEPDCRGVQIDELKEYIEKIINKNDDINLDMVIRFFIKDLYYAEQSLSNFYFKSLNIINDVQEGEERSKDEVYKNHILNSIQLRQPNLEDFEDNKIVLYDIMGDWRKQEKKFYENKHGGYFNQFLYRHFQSKAYLRTISIILSLIGVISFLEPFFYHKPFFEDYINQHWTAYLLMPILLIIGVVLFLLIIKTNRKADTLNKRKYMYMRKEQILKKRPK